MKNTVNLKTLSSKLAAYQNCVKHNNEEWEILHQIAIEEILRDLPSGYGLDKGVKFDWDRSTPDKLIFLTHFHHMVDGYYTEWTSHTIRVNPSFAYGFKINIGGQDKNDIKEYLSELFSNAFAI